jgi:LysM repeat protein
MTEQLAFMTPQEACFRIYRVQKGDTLQKIARNFNVSLEKLMNANPQITVPNVILHLNQPLCLPLPYPNPRIIQYYVKPGDSLYNIARKYNVPLRKLIKYNPYLPSPYRLRSGRPLFLRAPLDQVDGICTFYTVNPHTDVLACEPFEEWKKDNIVAMNRADFDELCGACIHIEGPLGEIDAYVSDKMGKPTLISGTSVIKGGPGGIDLPLELFEKIANPEDGYAKVKWNIISCPLEGEGLFGYYFTPDSSEYWIKIQIGNMLHPVSNLAIYYHDQFQQMKRVWGYFTYLAREGLGEQCTFELTSCFGEKITEENIPIIPGNMITGKKQFTYEN